MIASTSRFMSVARTLAALNFFLRWEWRPLGRVFVQGLVVLLVFAGWPVEHTLRVISWDRVPIGQFFRQTAWAADAARIITIEPSCAGPGDQVTITGNGFGAQNMEIRVGGVLAQLLSTSGNRATFVVPVSAPAGVTTVTATNPGGHAGSIVFRVKTREICGNQIDEDCDGVLDDPAVCAPVNHPPTALAGADQTTSVR